MSKSAKRTPNQQAVMDALENAGRALTAYDILDDVRDAGIRAPVQVYRALERLVADGAVHRVESINAFVACAHDHDGGAKHTPHSDNIAFAICDDCGDVSEIPAAKAARTLDAIASESGFVTDRTVVELRGQCGKCAGDR